MAEFSPSDPMPTAAHKARAAELKKQLDEHGYRYYVLDQPVIADAEYDQLFHELVALEAAYPALASEDSPTHRIGGSILAEFAEVAHRVPMLSLGNAFADEDVINFDRRCREGLRHRG